MANRLENETSPYLLQHADNPVDWYPWGDDAQNRAKVEQKPIFLSIGYAACHWCHVMAHETFEDPQVAAYMNEHFINIKVDREERPDVDSIYMDAVVALTGQGGWPLSAFLTPEGAPFYGGTYFPPQRRFNMPSFMEVLESIQHQWAADRERLERIGTQLSKRVQSKPAFELNQAELEIAALDSAAEQLFEQYDWTHGGWGAAPKFPQAAAIEFLLQRYQRKNDRLALDMAKHVLRSMSHGGIYDQVAGGFHRYAVDARWLVPHFEKMLYDQAVLIPAYLHAWQLTGDPEFAQVIHNTWAFLFREMRDEKGGFYASLDADSEGEEGKFYVWTSTEIKSALPDEDAAHLTLEAYGLNRGPNFEGANVLHRPLTTTELSEKLNISAGTLRARLRDVDAELLKIRSKRPHPPKDDKVITAWNGLLLSALAESARALQNRSYLQAAQQLADFMLTELRTEDGWRRTWRQGQARHNATLRDLAAVGLGLINLYEADFNVRWFKEGKLLCREILEHYSDPDGGFFDVRDDQEGLIARPKSIQDTPIPSGNSLAVQLFLQMYYLDGDDRYAASAEKGVRGMQRLASRHPTAFAGWLNALNYAIGPALQLAVLGDPETREFAQFIEPLDARYLPLLTQAGGFPGIEGQPALLDERSIINDQTTGYLCLGFVCNRPTTSVDELLSQLDEAIAKSI